MRMQQQSPAIAAQIQQAVALHRSGKWDQAEELYRKVLRVAPNHFQALYLLGMLALHREQYAEAVTLIDRALKINPEHADAQFDRATALEELQRYPEALRSYDLVLLLRPDFTDAQFRRGNVLRAMQRFSEALQSYQRVLLAKPDFAEALFKHANTLHDLKRIPEALEGYRKTLELEPEFLEALFNMGNALKDLNRLDEALLTYQRALAIAPDFVQALVNSGYVQHNLKQPQAALQSYDQALAIQPDEADALFNRGIVLEDLQRHEEALDSYARAQALDPDAASPHWNEGLCRLRLGQFEQGWEKYEWRWQTEQLREHRRELHKPLWLGQESLEGQTILLHAEQGFGDTLQFCRFVPLVAARGARVILQVQPQLKSLLTPLAGVSMVVTTSQPLPHFDFHCPLISLPLALGMRAEQDIPVEPYLQADARQAALWSPRLAPAKLRVGLVWAGNPRTNNPEATRLDALRSIKFATLAPLLEQEGIDFYSLQLGDAAQYQLRSHPLAQRVIDHSRFFYDFSDTAALISQLDLVISVDTSVCHLAAALNRPTWLLNRYNTCWRWLLERDDSPWYPSLRIFRQTEPGDWDGVIARVSQELSNLQTSRA